MRRGKSKGKDKKPQTNKLADTSNDQPTNSVVKKAVACRDQSKQMAVNAKCTTKRRKSNSKEEQTGNKKFCQSSADAENKSEEQPSKTSEMMPNVKSPTQRGRANKATADILEDDSIM